MNLPSTPMPSALSPIAEQERIRTLDIVRAVALFGVFLMNVEYFARPLQAPERMIEPGLRGLNHALAWFEYVFMHGKFWTLFAMLFGMGFAVMLGRAEMRGGDFAAPYLRRTAALMAIGLAHGVLVWGGDILHSYAIGACVLLVVLRGRWWWLLLPSLAFLAAQVAWGSSRALFTAMIAFLMFAGAGAFVRERSAAAGTARRFPYSTLLSWTLLLSAIGFGVLWIVSPGFVPLAAMVSSALLGAASFSLRPAGLSRLWRAGASIYLILPLAISATILLGKLQLSTPAQAPPAASAAYAAAEAAAAQAASINASGSYAQNVALRWDYLADMLTSGEIYLLISVVGMFLIGFWFVRAGAIGDVQANRGLFRRMAAFGIPVGIALALSSAAFYTGDDPAKRDQAFLAANLMTVANLALSLGYLGALVLFVHSREKLRLRWLAPAGRMALTNYLTQSVVGTLVFYGYGLGLRMDRIGQLALVIGVFALQVLASRWWMSRFHFGPAEWFWRAATYARWPPLFRHRAPAAAIAAESA
ncbi:DUF418 domain-containing protein [Luteimonas sp. SX5]|uniref:DUF418 domain-containing protein n=1 Tax=Luteimonas galliterrae TaxID=2940486 RepID=A0ABT0MJE5_9GAMM|nr:DUF418 domain-containing protein [Luteimonas galliterrae]MCL1634985.1 DUF418 domain-containing protein [Luteimonas galliterrae]